MSTLITVVHVMTCLLLITIVLLQSGKGAEISASLGGSSQTIFGSSGGANFFTRLTSILAAIFFATSVGLTLIENKSRTSVVDSRAIPTATTAPSNEAAAPSAPAASEAPAPAK